MAKYILFQKGHNAPKHIRSSLIAFMKNNENNKGFTIMDLLLQPQSLGHLLNYKNRTVIIRPLKYFQGHSFVSSITTPSEQF